MRFWSELANLTSSSAFARRSQHPNMHPRLARRQTPRSSPKCSHPLRPTSRPAGQRILRRHGFLLLDGMRWRGVMPLADCLFCDLIRVRSIVHAYLHQRGSERKQDLEASNSRTLSFAPITTGIELVRRWNETDSKSRPLAAQPRKRESAGLEDDQRPSAACRTTSRFAVKLMTERNRLSPPFPRWTVRIVAVALAAAGKVAGLLGTGPERRIGAGLMASCWLLPSPACVAGRPSKGSY
jgi:hypothetical protein